MKSITELASDVRDNVFISDSIDGANERLVPHEVLRSAFTLEFIFSHMHPRVLCVAARVNSTWNSVAYEQRALWKKWDVAECLSSAHSRDVLHPRFGRLLNLRVPTSFLKAHGTQTDCANCLQPLPAFAGALPFVCTCATPMLLHSRDDAKEYFEGNFAELETLILCVPPRYCIDPAALTHFTGLTKLCLENLNPVCAATYGALVTQNTQLRGLTYLTRPWKRAKAFPFSFKEMQLESLEVNQVDFEDILHMTTSLRSLKINGYAPVDKYTKQVCVKSVEMIIDFTQLEALDITGLDPSEVPNPPWVAMHVCMLTNLQRLHVGPLFAMEDFAWMFRDLAALREVGVDDNPYFSNTILQDFAASNIAANITSLSLRNCIDALTEPVCLSSFVSLRKLHIEQNPSHGRTLQKLVPTVIQMTKLVDLALIGLSINPVSIYPKLTQLQRLILNRTPTSDADVLIMSKKMPELRHLGLVGCYHVKLNVLLTITKNLRVLEWDEPEHLPALIASNKELHVIVPPPKEVLHPTIWLD